MLWILMWTFDFNSSLLAPMKSTNVREVGQYSLLGSAIPFKRYIQLTSRNTKDSGAVCRRIKNLNDNWDIYYAYGAIHPNSTRTQIFYYTKEFCPENSAIWTGFAIKMQYLANSDNVSIYIHTNNYTAKPFPRDPSCVIPIHPESRKMRFHVSYENGNVLVNASESFNPFIECGSFYYNLTHGYFSLYSSTEGETENNNLLNFVYTPHSPEIPNPEQATEEAKNRKALLHGKKRKANKNLRRMRQKYTTYYRQQMQYEGQQLNGGTPNTVQLRRAFKEINELYKRAAEGLDIKELKSFIEETVDEKMKQALDKLQSTADAVNEFKATYNEIFSNSANALKDILMETKIMMDNLNSTLHYKVSDLFDMPSSERKTLDENIVEKNDNFMFSLVMIIVCFIEFVLYIVFFLYKHKVTDHFHKAD